MHLVMTAMYSSPVCLGMMPSLSKKILKCYGVNSLSGVCPYHMQPKIDQISIIPKRSRFHRKKQKRIMPACFIVSIVSGTYITNKVNIYHLGYFPAAFKLKSNHLDYSFPHRTWLFTWA